MTKMKYNHQNYTTGEITPLNYQARIYVNNYNEYKHIYMDFYYVSPEDGQKNFTHDLSSFQVSCQIDKESIQRDYNPCYAIHFEYKDMVNSKDYKEVVKVLKVVEKGLNDYRANYGSIETMGEYLAVVCNIIGIKNVSWNDDNYRTGDIKSFIDYYLQTIKENYYAR